MRSSFWWPRNCCKSSQAAVIHGEGAGGGFGGAWHPWLTAALDKHPRRSELAGCRHQPSCGCWSGAGPKQQLQSPSSLHPPPAPKSTTPSVVIARGSTITSIKKNDPGWGHQFYSPLEALLQRCCTLPRDVSLLWHGKQEWSGSSMAHAGLKKEKDWGKKRKRNKKEPPLSKRQP